MHRLLLPEEVENLLRRSPGKCFRLENVLDLARLQIERRIRDQQPDQRIVNPLGDSFMSRHAVSANDLMQVLPVATLDGRSHQQGLRGHERQLSADVVPNACLIDSQATDNPCRQPEDRVGGEKGVR